MITTRGWITITRKYFFKVLKFTVERLLMFHKQSSTGHKPEQNSLLTSTALFLWHNKKGLLLSLISRYFNICSSYKSFHCEVLKFKQIFFSNGHPTVYNYKRNCVNYSLLLTHIYLFALFSVLLVNCLTFFHSLRTIERRTSTRKYI